MFHKKFLLLGLLSFLFASFSLAQISTISLEQTKGEFTIQGLTLAPGDYQFDISNNGVPHEVGFVLAPKGKTDQANHIKNAYVKETVKNGSSSLTSIVSLTAGDYVYFCPLNPTEQYPITVSNPVKKIVLEQTPGVFTKQSLTLSAGSYQFEIVNNGVSHEVGFVLAPKGKTDQANHIKDAYVTKTATNGTSSFTNTVSLEAGEYVYFCPLNPTKEYPLTVE